jgi:lantibiotic modifying enzyme
VENRIFFDENGKFDKFEIHLVTRDKDGNALPEKTISIDWPSEENDDSTKQAIPIPKSSSGITYEQLGYLESFDAVVDKLYAFLVYKEIRNDNSKWRIHVKGSVTAGTVFDPANKSLENAVQKAHAHEEKYLVWGFNLLPKEDDPR